MASEEYKLQFIANLDLSDMKTSLNQLQGQLDKIGMPKSLNKSMSSTIENLKKEISNLESLTTKETVGKSDMRAIVSSYEKIDNLVRRLNNSTRELNSQGIENLLPADQVEQLKSAEKILVEIRKLLDIKSQVPQQIEEIGKQADAQKKKVDALNEEIKKLTETRNAAISKGSDLKNRKDEINAEIKLLDKRQEELRSRPKGTESKRYKDLVGDKTTQGLIDVAARKVEREQIRLKKAQDLLEAARKQSRTTEGTRRDRENNVELRRLDLEKAQAELERLRSEKRSLNSQKAGVDLKEYKDNEEQLKALKQQLADVQQEEAHTTATQQDAKKAISDKTKELDKETKVLDDLKAKLEELKASDGVDQAKIDELKNQIQALTGEEVNTDNLEELEKILEKLKGDALKGTEKQFEEFNDTQQQVEGQAKDTGKAVGDEKEEFESFDKQMSDINSIKSRIQYFFGLNNTIQLLRRTLRSAYETIKELDKAMTETAVVTNFSVGDMWSQLPEYTKRANELGVTTKAAYEAATLFYQQGLNTNEVMAMSNETLKMARIAGLDAAVATDRMTNAIRGFNMEINTMNAQRIDDVYSRLAAISASNADEISTAMTKVASLAHSANMEFETTAAFLAQIIETTRESAETAGTALKTVVARFTEVKKLVSEDQLEGTDEDGELIDVNKVSSALRTAGIDLNKYFLGEVGLDDIFMELASKWGSLSTLQQRYIATQAAGSRQQSRFIALMSDYARTQELVGEAYNANGAAAKQFAKTQESLESKLAKLKNAWDEFAMGIANSSLVKAGIDTLTTILNIVNELTSGFGILDKDVGSFINGFLKLGLAIGGLNVGKGLTNGLLTPLFAMFQGKTVDKGFMELFTSGMGIKAQGEGAGGFFKILGKGFANPFVKAGSGIGKGFQSFGKRFWSLGSTVGGIGDQAGYSYLQNLILGSDAAQAAGGGTLGLTGLTSLVPTLGTVAVAAVAAYAVIKKLYDASPAGQVKIAQKYADTMSEVATEAKNSAKELESVRDRYKELNSAIDNAVTPQERAEAIKSRTEYIRSLLEQNAAYAQYIKDDVKINNGQIELVLDEEQFSKAITEGIRGANTAEGANLLAQANLAYQQYQKAEADRLEYRSGFNINLPEEQANAQARLAEIRSRDFKNQSEIFYKQAIATFAQNEDYFADIDGVNIAEDIKDDFINALSNTLLNQTDIDAINKEIEQNLPTGSKEELQELYKETFGTLTVPDYTVKQLKQAIASAKVAEQKAQQLADLYGKIGQPLTNLFNSNKGAANALLDLINNGGENLGRATIEKLASGELDFAKYFDGVWNALDEATQAAIIQAATDTNEEFGKIPERIKSYFKESRYDTDTYGIDSYIEDLISNLTTKYDLSLAGSNTLVDTFSKAALNGGDVAGLGSFTDELLAYVKPENYEDFFAFLRSMDVTDTKSIERVFAALESSEIVDFSILGKSSNEVADDFANLSKATKNIDFEKFKEDLTSTISTIKKIREGEETDASFSEEEFNELIKKGLARDNFVYTGIEGEEYVYTGELDEIITILSQQLSLERDELTKQLDNDITTAKAIEEQTDVYDGKSLSEIMQLAVLNQEIDAGTLQALRKNEFLQAYATEKGYDINSVQEQGFLNIFEQLLPIFQNLSTNQAKLAAIIKDTDQAMAFNNIGPEYTFKQRSHFEQTPHNATFERQEELPQYTETGWTDAQKAAIEGQWALDQNARDIYDSVVEGVKAADEATEKYNLTVKDQEVFAKSLSTAWSQNAAKLKELNDLINKNDDIITAEEKDLGSYKAALNDVKDAINETYGTNITEDFVEAHWNLITAAQESRDAYLEFLDVLSQSFIDGINGTPEVISDLELVREKMLDVETQAQLMNDFDIHGVASLDDEPFLRAIGNLYSAGIDVESFLNSLGWTAQITGWRTLPPPLSTRIPAGIALVPNSPGGPSGYTPRTSSGGGGGGGSKQPTEWENEQDWLYNLMEDIDELERQQTKLSEKHDRYLEDISKTGRDLFNLTKEELNNLYTQRDNQQEVYRRRRQEMDEQLGISGLTNYVWWNDKDSTVEIDWDAIEAIQDQDTYKEVSDLISKVEKIQDEMDDAQDALWDIEGQITELEQRYLQEFVDFQQRILDAVVKSYQDSIDNLSALNDNRHRKRNY